MLKSVCSQLGCNSEIKVPAGINTAASTSSKVEEAEVEYASAVGQGRGEGVLSGVSLRRRVVAAVPQSPSSSWKVKPAPSTPP